MTRSPVVGVYLLLGPEYKEVYEHPSFFGNLKASPGYAFRVEKTIGTPPDTKDTIDLVYFIYCP